MAICLDGFLSHSQGSGTCSHHGGLDLYDTVGWSITSGSDGATVVTLLLILVSGYIIYRFRGHFVKVAKLCIIVLMLVIIGKVGVGVWSSFHDYEMSSTTELVTVERSERSMPQSRRDRLFARDGIPEKSYSDYELDHKVPLCLYGSDKDDNISAQPRRSIEPVWNAERKDALEDFLCQMVHNGTAVRSVLQHEIATDWHATYNKYLAGVQSPVLRKRN